MNGQYSTMTDIFARKTAAPQQSTEKNRIERIEALISNFSGLFVQFLSRLAYNLRNFIYICSVLPNLEKSITIFIV